MTEGRFLILNSSPLELHGLKNIMEQNFPDTLVDWCRTPDEAFKLVKANKYTLQMLSIPINEDFWIDSLIKLHSFSNAETIYYGPISDPHMVIRAFQLKASGFISSQAEVGQILVAFQKVLANERYISPDLTEKIVLYSLDEEMKAKPHIKLSHREYQVMLALAKGKRIKEIAKEIFLSDKSVSTYRNRVLKKLNMQSNYDIMVYALKNKLITL